MNRREFLQTTLAATALGAVAHLPGVNSWARAAETPTAGPQVTRRRYRDTDLTVPLLGFGMMRLPRLNPDKPEVDYATAEKQIARALAAGVNYFDTAYFYHNGLSEKCAGDLLSKYPRSSYFLASKMPVRALKVKADVERIWNEQLARCKTEYFDFYLVHNLNRERWQTTIDLQVYEFLEQKKREGKIRRLGFSFHDEPEILKTIVAAHPWDCGQIQLNYLDWTLYRSQEQYEILTKANIPVLVMEPLRGGALATLNPAATAIFKKANPAVSPASWAFRYAGSLPNVLTVLSGMTLTEHLEDNIKTFTDFKPLTDAERETIAAALAAYRQSGAIPCTACRYCVPCPVGVDIPRVFGLYNHAKVTGNMSHFKLVYDKLDAGKKAGACVACGVCKKKCPQHIDIPAELKKIAAEVEKGGKVAAYLARADEEIC